MKQVFDSLPDCIKIVDIGAMFVGREPYDKLVEAYQTEVIGFEANAVECEKLNEMARLSGANKKYLPYAVGTGEITNFYLTNTGYTSSLLEPNAALLSLFTNLQELTEVVAVRPMLTQRLDDVSEVLDADYLKIDAQGAEKDILDYAKGVLKEAVVVHIEVEFAEMYKGQALFGDMDVLLRENGFAFHKFTDLCGRTFKPLQYRDGYSPLSQVLWGNAVYVKDFMNLEILSAEKLKKLVIILHELYYSVDYCHYALEVLDKMSGSHYAEKYRCMVTRN